MPDPSTTDTGQAAIDAIISLLSTEGARRYGEEAVSQLAHALQCATLAERTGAADGLVVAALLHDIGHLIDGGDAGLARRGIDARHEHSGADYLARWFGLDVTEPVRLHVEAKRYLCRVEADYFDRLSPASVHSLEVQGGIHTPEQADAFAAAPYGQEAARLRQWDEAAKDPAAQTPGLEHFRRHMVAVLAP